MIEELKNKKIKINTCDNQQITVKYGTTAKDVYKLLDMEDKDILAVRVNNSVRDLNYRLCENSHITPVRYNSNDGYRIYIRTVKFLLYMAIKRVYPNLDIEVGNIQKGIIYFICHGEEFTNDIAVNLLKEMRTIVAKDSPFTRKVVTYEEARMLFETTKNVDALDNMVPF